MYLYCKQPDIYRKCTSMTVQKEFDPMSSRPVNRLSDKAARCRIKARRIRKVEIGAPERTSSQIQSKSSVEGGGWTSFMFPGSYVCVWINVPDDASRSGRTKAGKKRREEGKIEGIGPNNVR